MLAQATAEVDRPKRRILAPRDNTQRFSLPTAKTWSSSAMSEKSFSLKSLLPFAKHKKHTVGATSPESSLIFQSHIRQENTLGPIKFESPLASLSLLSVPSTDPWLKVETGDFDSTLDKAIHELQNDFASGARQLADASLRHLAHLSDTVACATRTWGEFWGLLVYAAKHLSNARPSMGAAITACLLRALERIARKWNDEQSNNGRQSPSDLACIAQGIFDEILRERKQLGSQLGTQFAQWLQDYCEENTKSRNTIRILTLSNSSTIRTAILHALPALPNLTLSVTILESRPRCEGADMASQIYHSASDRDRLSIRIIPDCAVGTASKDIDLVLLGADRISPRGDVSNKIGSLAATLCAKMHNQNVTVVVLSDSEKIAASEQDPKDIEYHSSSELTSAWSPGTRIQLENKGSIDIYGEWVEWVPARFVDAYVTEKGIMETEEVKKTAKEIEELEKYIFQHLDE